MACAALLRLKDKLDASRFNGGSDAVGLMADDAVDVLCGHDLLRCGDDVEKEGSAAYLVKNFGALTLEPRAFTGGHDGNGES
jgi:hypothetical protein